MPTRKMFKDDVEDTLFEVDEYMHGTVDDACFAKWYKEKYAEMQHSRFFKQELHDAYIAGIERKVRV